LRFIKYIHLFKFMFVNIYINIIQITKHTKNFINNKMLILK
jgi:hypothetical protein